MASKLGKTYATSGEIAAVVAAIPDISTANVNAIMDLIGKRVQLGQEDTEIAKTLLLKLTGHPYSKKNILTFELEEQTGAATIDHDLEEIDIEVENGTDVTKLAPTITVSTDATVSPASGVITDFSNPVEYTVTAEDGTTKVYTVTVTIALP